MTMCTPLGLTMNVWTEILTKGIQGASSEDEAQLFAAQLAHFFPAN